MVMFIKDIQVELQEVRGDFIGYYLYDEDICRLVNPYDDRYFPPTVETKIAKVRELKRSYQTEGEDPETRKIVTETYSFAVTDEVWEKLGMLPNYLDAVEEELKLSRGLEKQWWSNAIKLQKQLRKYEEAPFLQRVKYLLQGKL